MSKIQKKPCYPASTSFCYCYISYPRLHLFKLNSTCYSLATKSLKNRQYAIVFYRMILCIAQTAIYAVAKCLTFCPSHANIVSKRLNKSSNFFTIG